MKVRAAVVRGAGQNFSIETLNLSALQANEVLVRIVATGLCHTDLVVRDQILPVPLPAVLGHEGAGTVEAVGSDVTTLAPGDNVILGFAACHECGPCRAGAPAYCQDFAPLNFGGCRPDGSTCLDDGTHAVGSHFFGQSSFATHAIAAARNLVKVPAGAPLELLGPLGCGMMTGAGAILKALDVTAADAVLVTGAGPVGLSGVMAAASAGAHTIIVSDPLESRRTMALELGATHALDPAAGVLAELVRAIVPGGVNAMLDTSGASSVVEAGIGAMAVLGRLAMVGVPSNPAAAISLNMLQMLSLGIRVCGVTEGNADPQTFLPELIALHAAGRFPFDRMIRSYPLAQINEAVADQHAGRCVKAVLTM
jgi:aryl-alcohol dehydrogenase